MRNGTGYWTRREASLAPSLYTGHLVTVYAAVGSNAGVPFSSARDSESPNLFSERCFRLTYIQEQELSRVASSDLRRQPG